MMVFLRFSLFFLVFIGDTHASHATQFKDDRSGWLHQVESPDQAVFMDKPQRPSGTSEDDDTARADVILQESTVWHPTFSALLQAVEVMQSHYFEVWVGTWPRAIDWTAAVMGTQISSTLSSMSGFKVDHLRQHRFKDISERAEAMQKHENLINQYFTQITAFYFGENAFGLRLQAFDDMLWVVLGWLESIKFINLHSKLNYNSADRRSDRTVNPKTSTWYGQQFIPQFAHRARLFYDFASKGWNTSLCGGGMIWNPYLTPYKNAITNQLFIAASIGMYLYFPGDNNSSPFLNMQGMEQAQGIPPAYAHDSKYLDAAIEAYQWLSNSNMTNEKGLYVDGFHIQGWRGGQNGSRGTGNCDVRDEQVYTYNQGVLLSGLRGLWDATGAKSYLDDGHELIRNVIAATGWHQRHTKNRWEWAGIGRNGILEERCDSSGTCSQNGQTFKGIFFHHLTIFCSPLSRSMLNYDGQLRTAEKESMAAHRKSCDQYGAWIRHNAHAAEITRDPSGKFGTWWGKPFGHDPDAETDATKQDEVWSEGTDYRNQGVPNDDLWRLPDDPALKNAFDHSEEVRMDTQYAVVGDERRDPNDRGRGRTVETQSGGLAVLRALWQMVDRGKFISSSVEAES